jgi:hypothetical protein
MSEQILNEFSDTYIQMPGQELIKMRHICHSPDKDRYYSGVPVDASGPSHCRRGLSSLVAVGPSLQMVLTWRPGARVWCWGMAVGVSVNGPSHANHVSPSFGPLPFMCIGREGRGVVVKGVSWVVSLLITVV